MSYRAFTFFSVLGSFTWAGGIIVAGYLLGNVPIVRDNIEILIVASVLTVVVPMAVHVARRWRATRRRQGVVAAVDPTPPGDQAPRETR